MSLLPMSWHDLTTFYTHLTSHIVPGPTHPSYILPFILLPLALLIPPQTLSHRQLALIFLPLIYACQIHYSITYGGNGVDVISVNLALWSAVLLGWRDPRKEFRRIWVVKGKGKWGEKVVEETYPVEWKRRVNWVLTLMVSLRLTGWRVGDASHDRMQPPPRMSRTAFLKVAGSTIALGYLILDLSSWYVRSDPYFFASGMSVDAPFPPPSEEMPTVLVLVRLLPPRLVRSSVLAGQIYAMVTSMFFLPTLPAVGLNALDLLPDEWSPQTWPVFFGNFSAIGERGLQGLWGSWWHRMNREMTASQGRGAAELLGIPSKSTLRYAMIATAAFFFSGIVHMGMITPQPQSRTLSASMMRLRIAAFFWAQIPAFGVEVIVANAVARTAPGIAHWPATWYLIFIWVAAWLCMTLPLLTAPFREIGYWHYYAVPISVLQGLSGDGWLTW